MMIKQILGGVYWGCSKAFNRGVLPGLSRGLKASSHDAAVLIEHSDNDKNLPTSPRMG